jgi:hypothetical protein
MMFLAHLPPLRGLAHGRDNLAVLRLGAVALRVPVSPNG